MVGPKCIQRALEANYDVSIERLSTRIARARVLGERGAFEPVLFGDAGRTSDTSADGGTNVTVDTDSGEVGT